MKLIAAALGAGTWSGSGHSRFPGCRFTAQRFGYPAPSQLKVMAAGIGAGARVAMGALTAVFSAAPGNVGQGPEITLGETTTSTTAPTEPETSVATPPVTATTPEGCATP